MRKVDDVLVRRAHALLVEFDGTAIRITNFLTRRSAVVTAPVLAYLRELAEPMPRADALARLRPLAGATAGALDRLIESTVVHRVGSAAESEDREWARTWGFGIHAAALHFARRSAVVIDTEERARLVQAAAPVVSAVPLAVRHAAGAPTVRLPPGASAAEGIASIMAGRRSARRFAPVPVPPDELSRVLFAIVGVTGGVDDPVLGPHPLSLSPSGGARNPYEAYLFAYRVQDLEPGTYHYDQCAQTLLRLGDRPSDLAAFAGGQEWAAQAAFVVVMVAFFDRVWSKYPTPAAYVNVLLEAGHRAQNALLVGAERGLAARMTTAIDAASADEVLGLCASRQAPVYLLAFGRSEGTS